MPEARRNGEPTQSRSGRPVYLHGRGLVSALGVGLDAALTALSGPPPRPQRTSLGEGACPWRAASTPTGAPPLSEHPGDWTERCLAQVAAAVDEAKARRGGWLIVASSSFDMGALERGAPWHADALAFVESLARHLDWQGPVCTVSTACTSAVNALTRAQGLIACGEADDVLVLGLEAANRYSLAGFAALQLLAPWPDPACPPSDTGLVLGEAVAAVALSGRPARWRWAAGAQRVCGDDPAGPTAATLESALQEALNSAHQDAGVRADQVAWIKAHATGSPTSDPLENRILDDHLPPSAARLGLKRWLGHTQGASAAAELALLTRAIEAGQTSPFDLSDTGNDSLQTLATGAEATPKPLTCGASGPPALVSITLGFGGGHGVLVLQDLAHADGPSPGAPAAKTPSASGWHRIAAVLDPCGEHWREDLVRRLGHKPRRLGPWAERALHGALCALEAAGESQLSPAAHLVVCSTSGPVSAVGTALEALRQDQLPMPYTFLQSQAAVMLSSLAAHLGWRGDAQALALRDPEALVRLVLNTAPPAGVLLGWVEENGPCRWWRLRPAPNGNGLLPLSTRMSQLLHGAGPGSASTVEGFALD